MSSHNNNSDKSVQKITCHYQSKYEKWYWMLVYKRENNPYEEDYEKHHPVPISLWDDKKANKVVVQLSRREHFIAHLLLMNMNIISKNKAASALNNFLKGYMKSNKDFSVPTNLKNFWDKIQFKYDDLPNKPWEHTYRDKHSLYL